eukprot:285263-Chlamydomonas_euryale.AAC.1
MASTPAVRPLAADELVRNVETKLSKGARRGACGDGGGGGGGAVAGTRRCGARRLLWCTHTPRPCRASTEIARALIPARTPPAAAGLDTSKYTRQLRDIASLFEPERSRVELLGAGPRAGTWEMVRTPRPWFVIAARSARTARARPGLASPPPAHPLPADPCAAAVTAGAAAMSTARRERGRRGRGGRNCAGRRRRPRSSGPPDRGRLSLSRAQ